MDANVKQHYNTIWLIRLPSMVQLGIKSHFDTLEDENEGEGRISRMEKVKTGTEVIRKKTRTKSRG